MLSEGVPQLGFAEQGAESAINSVPHATLAVCLDWLCLHIPEDELPLAFAPGRLLFTPDSICACVIPALPCWSIHPCMLPKFSPTLHGMLFAVQSLATHAYNIST